MEKYSGKSILRGIAIGNVKVHEKKDIEIVKESVDDTANEIKRYDDARKCAVRQIDRLYEKAVKEVGEGNAAIFEAHKIMLEDLDYIEAVRFIILNEKVNAEYAIKSASDNFAEMFLTLEDEYMQGRAEDVKDVSDRMIRILQCHENEEFEIDEPQIIFAEDLTPSETILLDKSKILGIVTRKGSMYSHTAILARTMNIPAVIGVDFSEEANGKKAVIDGYSGEIYIEPEEYILNEFRIKKSDDEENKKRLNRLKGKPNITLDGKEIKLYANIGKVTEVMSVLQNDAEGIGLFRSEFLYLERNTYPSEEEQFNAYKSVAENMGGKPVIIRTLDIGGDKQAKYFNIEHEENPAMGYRAIRICLDRRDMFKTQIRAIYRASLYGNISIMFPMIISVDEVKEIKSIVEEVKMELRSEMEGQRKMGKDTVGEPYGKVKLGIMIETPAAVMISDLLAKEVDFFSIGTNDLTQYTLAVDRQNPKLDNIYDSHHEAVMRMIKMVVDNAHKEGCKVGICGEAAADTTLTEEFLKMGIDELSVSPTFILEIRDVIRKIKSR